MKLIRMDAVKAITGHRSHASIYLAIRNGLFPTSVKIGPRSVAWPEQEVEAVCRALVSGLNNEEIRLFVEQLRRKRSQAVFVESDFEVCSVQQFGAQS